MNKHMLFEGHGRWFSNSEVSKNNRFVIFSGVTEPITLDDIVDIEDEFNITLTHIGGGMFVFRILHDDN